MSAAIQFLISLGVPNETQDEPPLSVLAGQPVDSLLQFLESIKYPQRVGLERPDRASERADRVSASAASSAGEDITDRGSIPAGRINQIGPVT